VAEESERGAVAAGNPGDKVGALGLPRDPAGLDAVAREVVAEDGGRPALVAGRVDRVGANQLL
jgi:hypothetical protein